MAVFIFKPRSTIWPFLGYPILLSFCRLGCNDYLDLSGGIFSFTRSRSIPPLWNNTCPRLFVLFSALVQCFVRFSYRSSCNSNPIRILFFRTKRKVTTCHIPSGAFSLSKRTLRSANSLLRHIPNCSQEK